MQSKNLRTLDRSSFYTGFSFFFLDPYIQIIGVALGASVLEIGSFTAAVFAAQLVSNPLAGHLTDRIGRSKTLAVGCFVRVISLSMVGLAFLAQSPITILLGRTFQGFAAGFFWTASYAIVADETDMGGRGREFGQMSQWVNRGMLVGALGGFILLLIRLDLPPYLFAAAALLSGLYALKIVPSKTGDHNMKISAGQSVTRNTRASVGLLGLNTLNSFAMAALTSVMIVRVSRIVFTPTTPINTQAILIAIATAPQVLILAIAAPRLARFVDTLGRARPLVGSILFLIPVSYAFIWMSDLWQFALLGFLLSIAAAMASVALNAVVGDLYRSRRGLAYGGLNTSSSAGSVLGALVSGVLYTAGWDKLVITSVAVQVISLLALLLLWKAYLPYDVRREKPVITVITPKG